MAVSHELETIIAEAGKRKTENRDFVPVSFAQRRFCEIVLGDVMGESEKQLKINQYLPAIEWMTRPQTIDEFQKLKRDLIEIGYEYQSPYSRKTVSPILDMADEFKILLIDYLNEHLGRTDSMWWGVEGDTPLQTNRVNTYDTFNDLLKSIRVSRTKPWYKLADTARLGLLIGDFRIGDHKEHGEIIRKAKLAVGRHGRLVVVTPTKKTILNTTDKKDSWDDDNRIYRLGGNRFIDDLWVADMPEELYEIPTVFWEWMYSQISPDLVFLGEANHPLQPQYERLTRRYGGVLLINPEPVGTRSGSLLEIK